MIAQVSELAGLVALIISLATVAGYLVDMGRRRQEFLDLKERHSEWAREGRERLNAGEQKTARLSEEVARVETRQERD